MYKISEEGSNFIINYKKVYNGFYKAYLKKQVIHINKWNEEATFLVVNCTVLSKVKYLFLCLIIVTWGVLIA